MQQQQLTKKEAHWENLGGSTDARTGTGDTEGPACVVGEAVPLMAGEAGPPLPCRSRFKSALSVLT